jgi:hypothetical protein
MPARGLPPSQAIGLIVERHHATDGALADTAHDQPNLLVIHENRPAGVGSVLFTGRVAQDHVLVDVCPLQGERVILPQEAIFSTAAKVDAAVRGVGRLS